ncbi:MAG: hypothetical protein Q9160_004275 [Pyrenula sp. 1 TL-2023]
MTDPIINTEDIQPTVARMYDYYLGGTANLAVDRAAADHVMELLPSMTLDVKENRRFLRRCVQRMGQLGIRQFIDIGSGLPTAENTHEIAPSDAKVMYVDIDPSVAREGKNLVSKENKTVDFVTSDARDMESILSHKVTSRLIDFNSPVCLMLFAILHFLTIEEIQLITKTLKETLPKNSYIAMSHVTSDFYPTEYLDKVTEQYAKTGTPVFWRKRTEIEQLFGDFNAIEPGLVKPEFWKFEPETTPSPVSDLWYVGVYKVNFEEASASDCA